MKYIAHLPWHNRLQKRAFTLVEMLIVIVIIGLLLVLTLPSLIDTLKANRLSTAGETLINQLALAQQLSSSGNFPVEVRFYEYTTPDSPDSSGIQAYQLFRLFDQAQIDPSSSPPEVVTEKPLGTPMQLGNGIVISANAELSPLAAGALSDDSQKYFKAAEARFFSIRFNPDGGTTLNKNVTTSHLTLVNESDIDLTPPPNFYTIQVDPYNGKIRSYRP